MYIYIYYQYQYTTKLNLNRYFKLDCYGGTLATSELVQPVHISSKKKRFDSLKKTSVGYLTQFIGHMIMLYLIPHIKPYAIRHIAWLIFDLFCNSQDITQLRGEFPPNTWMDLLLPPGSELDQEMGNYLSCMRVSRQELAAKVLDIVVNITS